MALPPEGTSIVDMLRQNTDADFARLMRDSVPIHLTPLAIGNPLNSASRAPLSGGAVSLERGGESYDRDTDSYTLRFNYRLGFNVLPPAHPQCRSAVHDDVEVSGRARGRRPNHGSPPRVSYVPLEMSTRDMVSRLAGAEYANYADIERRILAYMSREIDRSMLTSVAVNNTPDPAVPGPTAAEAVAMLAAAMRRTGISMSAMDQMMSPGTLTGAELAAAYGTDPEVETPPPAPVNAPRPTRGRRRMVR